MTKLNNQIMNKKEEQTKGYLIANFTIHDQDTFGKYVEAGGSLAAKFNGKVIMFDTHPNIVEGSAESIIALMEFASPADVERFYNSPEYTAARKFRIASTTGWVVLAEGLPTVLPEK
jgi:uncharacterized protein (DUF1330 family)